MGPSAVSDEREAARAALRPPLFQASHAPGDIYQPGRLAKLDRPIHYVISGLMDRLFDQC